MTTLNFLEECKKLGKRGRVALIEAGKDGERCGASRSVSKRHSLTIEAEPLVDGLWRIYDWTKVPVGICRAEVDPDHGR